MPNYTISSWDVHYASGGMIMRTIERESDPDFSSYKVDRIPTYPETGFAYCTNIRVSGPSGVCCYTGKYRVPRDCFN